MNALISMSAYGRMVRSRRLSTSPVMGQSRVIQILALVWIVLVAAVPPAARAQESVDPAQQWLSALDYFPGQERIAIAALAQNGQAFVSEMIAAAQSGPSAAQISAYQVQEVQAYAIIQSNGPNSGEDQTEAAVRLSQTQASFVADHTAAYVAVYRTRAISGLAILAGVAAVQALQAIASGDPSADIRNAAAGALLRVGDLNHDGVVDLKDLAVIQAGLNTPATGPGDSRDLNRDGTFDIKDARILATICTYPRCASHP
jgi:hypothetical protein